MSQVRVRFAPSPTGFFHIGSARTALFNWLYARHTGGVFILRIEDTDQTRNSEAFLNVIYDSLTWLGLNWDEGPKVGGSGGGDHGPYRQSERAHIYREYLENLKATGRTYEKDGAIYFKLLGERHEVYDEHRKKTVVKVKNAPAIIDDRIRGRVERTEEKDFVIVRSDGNPVFHLVNVVDDITMGITHVIRGEDHLSNTSKHTELLKAFGAPLPIYAHIPLILKQNGPGKMSKRDQGALIEEYQKRGFLPEALVNFLCLLGWNPGDDREKMPIAEIIRLFDLPGVNQSNARFDEKKLAHMNMLYLLELPADQFAQRARDYFSRPSGPAYSARVCSNDSDDALGRRCGVFSGRHAAQPAEGEGDRRAAGLHPVFFHRGVSDRSEGSGEGDGQGRARRRACAELADVLPGFDFSSDAAMEEGIKTLAAKNGLGFGDYQSVARLALSGTNVGPSITGMMRVLGRDRVLARIGRFLAV